MVVKAPRRWPTLLIPRASSGVATCKLNRLYSLISTSGHPALELTVCWRSSEIGENLVLTLLNGRMCCPILYQTAFHCKSSQNLHNWNRSGFKRFRLPCAACPPCCHGCLVSPTTPDVVSFGYTGAHRIRPPLSSRHFATAPFPTISPRLTSPHLPFT